MDDAQRSQLEQWRRSIAMGPADTAGLTRQQALDLIGTLQQIDSEHRATLDALRDPDATST